MGITNSCCKDSQGQEGGEEKGSKTSHILGRLLLNTEGVKVRSVRNDDLHIQVKKKKSPSQINRSPDNIERQANKHTAQLDGDPSQNSGQMVQLMELENDRPPMSNTDRSKWKKKLSKKESLYFRPSEIENKLIDTIIVKVSKSKSEFSRK